MLLPPKLIALNPGYTNATPTVLAAAQQDTTTVVLLLLECVLYYDKVILSILICKYDSSHTLSPVLQLQRIKRTKVNACKPVPVHQSYRFQDKLAPAHASRWQETAR